jgi:hypothetical protein
MKDEDLIKKHISHKAIYRSELKNEEQQTINTNVITEFGNLKLRLRAFVSVGEAFLFLLEALKVHHNSAKKVTK